MRARRRSGRIGSGGAFFVSASASSRNGRPKIADLFLCVRPAPTRRQKTGIIAVGGAEGRFGNRLRRRRRPDSLLWRHWSRRKSTLKGSTAPRSRRNYWQTAQLRLRRRPKKRRMDKTQMRKRTGVCHWRIHTAAGRAEIFRGYPGRLLQGRQPRFRRQGRHWIYGQIIGDIAQEIPRRATR